MINPFFILSDYYASTQSSVYFFTFWEGFPPFSDRRNLCWWTLQRKWACTMNQDRVQGQLKQRRGKSVKPLGQSNERRARRHLGEVRGTCGKASREIRHCRATGWGVQKEHRPLEKVQCRPTRLQKSSLGKKKERNIGESKNIIEETTNIMRRCTILITKKVYSSVNYLQRNPLTLQQQIQQLLWTDGHTSPE